MLDRTQYEDFLTRAELVLGLDKTPATRQQWKVLSEGLYRLLEDRTPDQITDEMIEGQTVCCGMIGQHRPKSTVKNSGESND